MTKSPTSVCKEANLIGTSIVLFKGTLQDRARQVAGWPEDYLKRWATVAAHQRRFDDLFNLLEAYIALYGTKGGMTSPDTYRSYAIGLRAFLDYCERYGISLLRPGRDVGREWVIYLQTYGAVIRSGESKGNRRPMAPATIQLRLTSVKMLFRALRWARVTEANPLENVKAPSDPVAKWDKRQPYTEDEVAVMLSVADPVEAIIILLAAHAGLRNFESISLSTSDVDFTCKILTVQTGKGHKKRRVHMSPALSLAIYKHKSSDNFVLPHRSCGWIILRMHSLCERAGITYRAYHALRHYCGTRLMDRTKDINLVARHLGHAKVETAQIYAKWNDKRLEQAIANW